MVREILAATGRLVKPAEIARLADARSRRGRHRRARAGGHVGRAIATVATVLDPERVVVSGEGVRLGPIYLDAIRDPFARAATEGGGADRPRRSNHGATRHGRAGRPRSSCANCSSRPTCATRRPPGRAPSGSGPPTMSGPTRPRRSSMKPRTSRGCCRCSRPSRSSCRRAWARRPPHRRPLRRPRPRVPRPRPARPGAVQRAVGRRRDQRHRHVLERLRAPTATRSRRSPTWSLPAFNAAVPERHRRDTRRSRTTTCARSSSPASPAATLPDVLRADIIWVPEFADQGALLALDEEMPDFAELTARSSRARCRRTSGTATTTACRSTRTRGSSSTAPSVFEAGRHHRRLRPRSRSSRRRWRPSSETLGADVFGYAEGGTGPWSVLPWIWSFGGGITDADLTTATGYAQRPGHRRGRDQAQGVARRRATSRRASSAAGSRPPSSSATARRR